MRATLPYHFLVYCEYNYPFCLLCLMHRNHMELRTKAQWLPTEFGGPLARFLASNASGSLLEIVRYLALLAFLLSWALPRSAAGFFAGVGGSALPGTTRSILRLGEACRKYETNKPNNASGKLFIVAQPNCNHTPSVTKLLGDLTSWCC